MRYHKADFEIIEVMSTDYNLIMALCSNKLDPSSNLGATSLSNRSEKIAKIICV